MAESSDDAPVRESLRVFWQAALRHRLELMLSFLLPVGGVIMITIVPFYASRVLAGIAQQSGNINHDIIMLGIVSFVGAITNRVGFKYNMSLQADTMHDLNHLVFERLLSRSTGFHANRISGKLVSDAIDFVNSFGQLINTAFNNAFTFAASLIIGVVIVTINSWQLGLFVFVLVAVVLIWAGMDSRKRSKLRTERLVATKKLISHLSDNIVNAQTVKTFAQENMELKRNTQLNTYLADLRIRNWRRAGRSASNRMLFLMAMQIIMLLFIVHLTRNNPALLATGIFAATYTLALINRLFEINTLTRLIEEALLQSTPIAGMLRETIEIQDKPGAATLKITKGEISLQDVTFTYPENIQNGDVFHNFSLSVASGEKIGLVGPSGGGKSTLTRLLLRFDDVQKGSIYIDHQNIADVSQASLRHAIAYVPQEPLLFHRTIRENIAYSHPEISEKEIIKAAKKANAHTFIEKLPNGYDTIVGERGVKLSGGQRQRIAIARAILKDAPILILDEATSALDSENEVQVQKALWKLMEGRTTIVIAHRLSTIQRMDRIVVLDEGKVVEEGSHKSLLGKKGLYAQLWKHQSGGFLEEN